MKFRYNLRLGPVATLPSLVPRREQPRLHIRTLRENSFSCVGPRLFNLLPKSLKNIASLPLFKKQLDVFLQNIPDTPPTPGYIASNNNSLVDWVACGSPYEYNGDDTCRGGAALPDLA